MIAWQNFTTKDRPRVWFVGAGPGDPELLTVRAQRLIGSCEVCVYTGSLVPKEVVAMAPGKVVDSAGLTLDELEALMVAAHAAGHDVARVHTGDPVLFGAIAEQARRLDRRGIPWTIVPGVSSFTAAAAALGRELTIPELSQTVIVTRAEGRTPVPAGERLAALGQHGATLALFLSAALIDEVVAALTPGYGADCPVAVVQRASWADERIVTGTLADIAAKLRAARIRSQAIIFVGRVLTAEGFAESRLYAADFAHRHRKARRAGEGA
jgi:precorrin-4/cobalt-precorrin-4 C11-methyltransferase